MRKGASETTAAFSEYELAGLVSEDGGERLTRHFPNAGLRLPEHIHIDKSGERLLWNTGTGTVVTPPPDLLPRFLRLATNPTDGTGSCNARAVLRFARSFGPLDVWESEENWLLFSESLPDEWEFGEPLSTWSRYLAAFHAVLHLVVCAREKRRPSRAALRALGWTFPISHGGIPLLVTICLNRWVRLGRVTPAFSWVCGFDTLSTTEAQRLIDSYDDDPSLLLIINEDSDNPVFTMRTDSLFGHLALQLMQDVASTEGWSLCAACGGYFALEAGRRGRKPLYCRRPDCGDKARWRLSKRDAAARRRSETQNGKA